MVKRESVPHKMEKRLLEHLFTSRVRVDLLTFLLMRPQESFHIRALASKIEAQYSAVWKELINLEHIGLLTSEAVGGRKIYSINPECPILPELRAMVLKTTGAGDLIRSALKNISGIQAAFLFGSFAAGSADAQSDIDLMIIGQVALEDMGEAISGIEAELRREVNYLVHTAQEWDIRLAANDPLAHNIMQGSRILLIGDEDAIRRSAAQRAD